MSIVITDGRDIACDGQITDCTGMISGREFSKIRRLEDGRIMGHCGFPTDADLVEKLLNEGTTEWPSFDKESFEVLVVSHGEVRYFSHDGRSYVAETPAAIGCGCDMARGAYFGGANIREAAEIAATHHSKCGGTVFSMSLHDAEEDDVVDDHQPSAF